MASQLSGPPITDPSEPSRRELLARGSTYRSWPFRLAAWLSRLAGGLYGFLSLAVLLSVVANIPLIQVLSLGYVLEASGRVARSGQLRRGFPGLWQASSLTRGFLGSWLCLLPIFLVAHFGYEARLIVPDSLPSRWLWLTQVVLIVLAIPHILAAWFCGGRLRHFLWPLVAPLSLTIWGLRRLVGSSLPRPMAERLIGQIAPHLLEDISRIRPLEHWFLPAIVWSELRQGCWWRSAAERLGDFVVSLRLPRLVRLGVVGLVGSMIWLALPTALLVAATNRPSPISGLVTFAGLLSATVIFSVLLPLQTQYAASRRTGDLFALGQLWQRLRRAPLGFLLATLGAYALAAPLFLAKIEEIPRELLWLPGLLFVVASWLSRLAMGWTQARASRRANPCRWWYWLPLVSLLLPASMSFAVLMYLSRYVSWHGAWSMIENPVFLLPAPFWW